MFKIKKINFKEVYTKIKENLTLVLLIYGVVFTILFFIQLTSKQKLKTELKNELQNTEALSDSIEIYKNKSNETVFQKSVLIADKKRLEELNKELYSELKKEKAKVIFLSSALVNIKSTDTVIINSEVIKYPNGNYGIEIKYDTTYNLSSKRVFIGESKFYINEDGCVIPLNTEIYRDEIYVKIITGLKIDKDNKIKIFVRSDFPGFNVTQLEGDIVDPNALKGFVNKNKWSVGPNISVGIGANLKPSIFVGIGVQYNLFSF
jgi:hypothetical protein